MISWLDEVTARKEELFADLFRILRVASVREDELASPDAPVGPGPKAALEEFLAMAQEDGFQTKQFGPWAGRIEVGSGDQLVGILGHVDVVPVGTGWETDPFEPVIKDNRIYARGASDDKGPTVAAYFALKLLRELGLELNQRLHLIIGTDEESGWGCMDYYFKHAEMPDFGFSPDADFPIINGEKGNISTHLHIKSSEVAELGATLESFNAGLRVNMVPQDAKAVISGLNTEELAQNYAAYLEQHQLKGSVELNGDVATFEMVGKAAHGSTPEKGVNAATFLAQFLKDIEFNQVSAQEFIQVLAEDLHLGLDGSKLGVQYEHEVMGQVSMNVGIANYNHLEGGQIVINFRFPTGQTPEKMEIAIKDALKSYQLEIEMAYDHAKEPHYVPADDPLVKTLLDVYARQTGLPAHEMSIGGGTYGRLMPRGVAYGALFPDSIDTMHQANEFIAVDDLLRATAIYAEAIYLLTR
ncbi:dipeptidase PepV [Vaginisenegalia massiliensis]|uniref:dipeptidase PepV n=1 Tax=Vaginisenegalia massiliensis TaxID=2058294 RepID=UPI000F5413B0|nr:dipeptidase PepV [Vaginisenegalia massiliensis]